MLPLPPFISLVCCAYLTVTVCGLLHKKVVGVILPVVIVSSQVVLKVSNYIDTYGFGSI